MLIPPKLYVNGFPKSGLHLATQMVACLFAPVDTENNWYGTNPWTLTKYHLEEAVDKFSEIQSGQYRKGHIGYQAEIDELLNVLNVAMVLVYRDLRDVVVSQTYHILDDTNKLKHPGRKYYEHLNGDKNAVMLECITGNDYLPGIIERWGDYAKWMDCQYVLPVRFEDMVKRPHKVAKTFFNWVYGLAIETDEVYLDKDIRNRTVELMVSTMRKKDISVTFRKGKTGQWRREFTPEHVKAFKEMDKDNVLFGLGYVKKPDW